MADINPSLPAINELNATADPKILSALSSLVSTINNLEESNLAPGAVTLAKLATDITDLIVPIGTIVDYGGTTDPVSGKWILADGRAISRATYASLYSALGGASSPYGQGDNNTTFNIPDLRGRVTVAPDNMGTTQGVSDRNHDNDTRGASGGLSRVQLTKAEMPAHDHTGLTGDDSPDHTHSQNGDAAIAYSLNNGGVTTVPSGPSQQTGGASVRHKHSISSEGGGGYHENRQPFLVVNKIIRIS